MLHKIITGGQTGVDRTALDAAILLRFEHGGWCPKNRSDEKGTIPEKYRNLKEVSGEFKSDKENYDARTKKNIEDSDATLIFAPNSCQTHTQVSTKIHIKTFYHKKGI